MSFFNKLFGRNTTEQPPTTQEAIQKLLDTEELLKKKSDFIETKIEEQIQLAKANAAKNKRTAIKALKTKKRYEKQLTQIDGTLTTLEYQRETLENASSNAEILKTMGFAAKAFKTAQGDFDIDKVNDLKDEMSEQQDLAREIGDAISRPFGDEIDEDDLMRELEELEQEDLDDELANIPSAISTDLPKAPSKEKGKAKVQDDDLSELADWAS